MFALRLTPLIDDYRVWQGPENAILKPLIAQYINSSGHWLEEVEEESVALTTDLVSFWELEEASGTRVDSVTGTANDLTDEGTVTSGTGKVGTAAQFLIANGEYLWRGDNAGLSITGDMSVSAWVNLTAAGGTVCSKWLATGDQRSWACDSHGASNAWRFYVSNDGAATNVMTSAKTASTGVWYHIVLIHDATADVIKMYLNDDGSPDSKAHATNIFDGIGRFQLGSRDEVGDLTGLLDQVGIWNRVLTDLEITQLYNGGNGLSFAQMNYIAYPASRRRLSGGLEV